MIDSPENDLVMRGQAGDVDARTEVLERYEGRNRWHARRALGLPHHDDVLQAARIGTNKAIDGFDPSRGVSFATYAAALSAPYALNALKREAPRGEPLEDKFASDAVTPDRAVELSDLAERLRALIAEYAALTPLDRAIIHERLLADGKRPTLRSLAVSHSVSTTTVQVREQHLKTVVLRRVLAPLKGSI